jgi:hypothetical protein
VLVFTGLRTVADARCLSHLRFAPRCAELRGLTVKNFQTVEKTVKSSAVAFSLARVRAEWVGPRTASVSGMNGSGAAR